MEDRAIRVLLVDPDEAEFVLTRGWLREGRHGPGRFHVEWADNYDDARAEIGRARHDAYLINYRLGQQNGLELLTPPSPAAAGRRSSSWPASAMTAWTRPPCRPARLTAWKRANSTGRCSSERSATPSNADGQTDNFWRQSGAFATCLMPCAWWRLGWIQTAT